MRRKKMIVMKIMSIVMNTMKWKEENVEEDEKELRVARS
jgi:hypothetical protein